VNYDHKAKKNYEGFMHNIDLNKKTGKYFIIAATLAVYIFPIIFDLIINGWERVFSYFAADTFYYMTVAQNYPQLGYFSFDQQLPTNGFHPLYQVLISFCYVIFNYFHLSKPVILLCTLGISTLQISIAIVLLAKMFEKTLGKIPGWFVLLPVGPYALVMAPIFHRYGTMWSFTNGMESSSVILFFALLLWAIAQVDFYHSLPRVILAGLTVSLLFLSRLDHIFMVVGLGIMIIARAIFDQKIKAGIKAILVIGLIQGAVLVLYLPANYISFGDWFPVSGVAKSTFPAFAAARAKLVEMNETIRLVGTPEFGPRVWRYTQIIFPMLFSLFVLMHWISRFICRKLSPIDWIFGCTSLFALFLGLYNFLFVVTFEQGHWYFPVSITFISIVTIDWLEKNFRVEKAQAGLVALLMLGVLAFYTFVYHDAEYNQRYAWFYNESGRIQNYYAGSTAKFIEYDDGIIAYTTGIASLSGFGFNLDKEAFQALSQNQLLELAYQRGYGYIASYYYFGSGRFTRSSTTVEISEYLASRAYIGPAEVQDFTFSVDYMSEDGRFSIIKMEKAQEK
jgi:hypothetical protein